MEIVSEHQEADNIDCPAMSPRELAPVVVECANISDRHGQGSLTGLPLME
jgi:hypothetical protein